MERAWENHQDQLNQQMTTKQQKLKVYIQSDDSVKISTPDDEDNLSHSTLDLGFVNPTVKSRSRTNVALQAILKRNSANQESKQVKFN